MNDKRLFSYFGHVIWKSENGTYGFANGDGTDSWYETLEEAMTSIEKIEGIKNDRR